MKEAHSKYGEIQFQLEAQTLQAYRTCIQPNLSPDHMDNDLHPAVCFPTERTAKLVSKLFVLKVLSAFQWKRTYSAWSFRWQSAEVQQLTHRGGFFFFCFAAFNGSTAFLFLWASKISGKHFTAWFKWQLFALQTCSAACGLCTYLSPSVLRFSHNFFLFCFCKTAINKSSKENLIVEKKKKESEKNKITSKGSNLQS